MDISMDIHIHGKPERNCVEIAQTTLEVLSAMIAAVTKFINEDHRCK